MDHRHTVTNIKDGFIKGVSMVSSECFSCFIKKETKLRGLSPRANYTDRASCCFSWLFYNEIIYCSEILYEVWMVLQENLYHFIALDCDPMFLSFDKFFML
jgi:hypothetical protein